MKITNPVLTGFHADPSMIRVKDTYYIANSTFEWFPGIRLHESKDMVHWNTLPYPLGAEQLDMRGDPASGGVWAPDLSYADGRFWIVYSDVHIVNGAFKDVVNYLTTAEDIRAVVEAASSERRRIRRQPVPRRRPQISGAADVGPS